MTGDIDFGSVVAAVAAYASSTTRMKYYCAIRLGRVPSVVDAVLAPMPPKGRTTLGVVDQIAAAAAEWDVVVVADTVVEVVAANSDLGVVENCLTFPDSVPTVRPDC